LIFENGFLYRIRRESELGKLSSIELAEVIKQYAIPVIELLGGPRFSNISAIIDWEIGHKKQVSL